jgi:uncharacterized protein Yka (UPF0111/DUF47 family)
MYSSVWKRIQLLGSSRSKNSFIESLSVEIPYLISMLGLAISVATFFIGRLSASRQQGKTDGQMQTMLNTIVEQIHAISSKLDKMDEQMLKCVKDIARLEVRVDALEKRG